MNLPAFKSSIPNKLTDTDPEEPNVTNWHRKLIRQVLTISMKITKDPNLAITILDQTFIVPL